MARLARLLPLAMAVLIAACSSTTPRSAAPSATSTPTPRPSPTLVIASVPPASALPSDLFACDLATDTFEVSLHTPHGIVDARGALQAMGASPAPSASVATDIPDAGELVGGQSYTADFSLDLGDHRQGIAPKAIQATVSIRGSAAQARVDATGTSAGITLPDGHGAASLSIGLTFGNAPCPDLTSSVRMTFQLVAAATAAACPTGQPGYVALIADLRPALNFAGDTYGFTVQSFAARYANVAAIDEVPALAGFNPTVAAASLARGKEAAITSATKGITLTGGSIDLWRREDVLGSDGKVKASPGTPISTEKVAAKSGVITWTAPTATGAYIVGISPMWTQACMTGGGYVFVAATVG